MKNLTIITINQTDLKNFAKARNQALTHATTEWVFFCDQDEQISKELMTEINEIIKTSLFDAYNLKRVDYFLGRKLLYGENGHNNFVRLARKNWGTWHRPVHEVWLGSNQKIGKLQNPLIHSPHKSLSGFIYKINFYSQIEAQYRYEQHLKSSIFHVISYPIAKFIKNYFYLQGFRDGMPGLIMAILMSYHSFLTWFKLYLLWRPK